MVAPELGAALQWGTAERSRGHPVLLGSQGIAGTPQMLPCALLWDQPLRAPGLWQQFPGVGCGQGDPRPGTADSRRCTDDSADGAEGHACPWGTREEEEAQELPSSGGEALWRWGCSAEGEHSVLEVLPAAVGVLAGRGVLAVGYPLFPAA